MSYDVVQNGKKSLFLKIKTEEGQALRSKDNLVAGNYLLRLYFYVYIYYYV